MAKSIDDHPLADEQVAPDRHRAGQENVGEDAHEGSVPHGVAHMGFKESDIILVVGPLPEVVEGSIEKAVHDGDDPGEIGFFEEVDEDEEDIHWGIVDHFKDERLNLIADVSDGVYLLTYIQFRHRLFVLFCLPHNHFLCLPRYVHIVEDQVTVGEDQREAHDYPAQDVEAEPPQSQGKKSGDESCLEKRSKQYLLELDTLREYSASEGISVEEHPFDPADGEGIADSNQEVSQYCVYFLHDNTILTNLPLQKQRRRDLSPGLFFNVAAVFPDE